MVGLEDDPPFLLGQTVTFQGRTVKLPGSKGRLSPLLPDITRGQGTGRSYAGRARWQRRAPEKEVGRKPGGFFGSAAPIFPVVFWLVAEPTHLKNMQPSNWIMKPQGNRGENSKKFETKD